MSAIAGLSQPVDKRVERSDVARMLDRLTHCGPDGFGIWCEGHVGLGHRMLHTTPESVRERLPLSIPEAALAITCDARIDNRGELIQACGLAGPEGDIADSELILAAYQRWGESCVEKLLGDFSFAIWDGRKRQLLCARDHLGIKPLFYYHSGGFFAFATEIKALFSIPQVPRSLNETRIAHHLIGFFEDRATTFFDGILRLPPAHTLTVRPDGLQMRQYWQADPTVEIRRSSDAEYAEEFRAIFAEAVHCRLRSVAPVGALVSGGLDSSSIACMARNQLQAEGRSGALHTFSALFSEFPESDERSYINAVIQGGGFIPHFFDGDTANPLTDHATVLGELDEVFHGADLTLMRMFYAGASQQGVRVMLDGLGGDEMVSHGARHLEELLRAGNWHEFGQQASGLARDAAHDRESVLREFLQPYFLELKQQRKWWTLSKALLEIPRQVNESIPGFVGDYALRPLVHKWKRRLLRGAPGGHGSASAPDSILADDFAQSIGLQERSLRARNSDAARGRSAREAHCHAINSGRLWLAIEELARVAAPYGVEPRYPQLDKRLVEFSVALPLSQKLSQGRSRAVFRRAMNQVLPEEVRWRAGKAKFLSPFAETLRRYGREFLDATILDTPPALARYFNLPALRQKYQRFLEGADSEAAPVWRASNLIWWLQGLERALPTAKQSSEARQTQATAV
ncbi:MAG: lasso peptide isopeptide bond-forming cyclase [Acidobacteriia bacterium]|nr:lasso peptide isopeptide bond-forming cyclase [Terriglobia bacterium]